MQVLVTHHVELVLPGTDYIVHMREGRIEYQGTPSDLRSRGLLDDILKEESLIPAADDNDVIKDTEDEDEDITLKGASGEDTEVESAVGGGRKDKGKAASNLAVAAAVGIDAKRAKKTADEEEVRQTGSVKWKVYKAYLMASWVFHAQVWRFRGLNVMAVGRIGHGPD